MKLFKFLFSLSILLFISAFFLPTYKIDFFGTYSIISGWEACIYSFAMLLDSLSINFEISHLLSGIFALIANTAVIISVICYLRKSQKIRLLRIITIIGFSSTIWWIVHELYDGSISNLLIGYYVWASSVGGVLFMTTAKIQNRIRKNPRTPL